MIKKMFKAIRKFFFGGKMSKQDMINYEKWKTTPYIVEDIPSGEKLMK